VDGRNTYFSDDDEGPWRFILGDYVPMSNDFWALTYPTDAEDKNCLRMSATLDFKWDNCYCSAECYFICEKNL
jgi:hypothetical protein